MMRTTEGEGRGSACLSSLRQRLVIFLRSRTAESCLTSGVGEVLIFWMSSGTISGFFAAALMASSAFALVCKAGAGGGKGEGRAEEGQPQVSLDPPRSQNNPRDVQARRVRGGSFSQRAGSSAKLRRQPPLSHTSLSTERQPIRKASSWSIGVPI